MGKVLFSLPIGHRFLSLFFSQILTSLKISQNEGKMFNYKAGMGRLIEMTKHNYGVWPLLGIMGYGFFVVGVGVGHNLMDNYDFNWNWTKKKARDATPDWEETTGKQAKSLDKKFFHPPDWYRKQLEERGSRVDYSKPVFPKDRPPIEKLWREYQQKNGE